MAGTGAAAGADRPATGTVSEVVVGVDGSPGAAVALEWALAEAARRGVPLRAVLAWQPPRLALTGQAGRSQQEDELRRVLADAVSQAVRRTGLTDVPVAQALVEGHPVQSLAAVTDPSVLLVTGARGRSPVSGLLLGSVSQAVAQYADGPLVVVPHEDDDRTDPRSGPGRDPAGAAGGRRVVVGVDGSAACLVALRFAAEAARLRDARLHLVHAWVDTVSGYGGPPWSVPRQTLEEEAREVLDGAVRALEGMPEVDYRAELVEGLEYGVLLDTAAGADLLVVGSRGRGGWKGLLLGSVGVHCVAGAPCPVAVVRPVP